MGEGTGRHHSKCPNQQGSFSRRSLGARPAGTRSDEPARHTLACRSAFQLVSRLADWLVVGPVGRVPAGSARMVWTATKEVECAGSDTLAPVWVGDWVGDGGWQTRGGSDWVGWMGEGH